MPKFPLENERSHIAQRLFARRFGFAERIFNFWVESERKRWVERSESPTPIVLLASSLDVQSMRLFRSALEDCQRCEAFCANILARSHFETLLALTFILKEELALIASPEMDKLGKQKIRESDGRPKYKALVPSAERPATIKDRLTREQRTMLYVAHCSLQDSLFVQSRTEPEMAQAKEDVSSTIIPSNIDIATTMIGDAWTYILTSAPNTYSGLSIRNLAEVLDPRLLYWYRTIYHFQSRMVHAVDALKHFQVENGVAESNYYSSSEELEGALYTITAMFLACISCLQENIGFGSEVREALADFFKEFMELYPVSPPL